jgi:hypothetical protein
MVQTIQFEAISLESSLEWYHEPTCRLNISAQSACTHLTPRPTATREVAEMPRSLGIF